MSRPKNRQLYYEDIFEELEKKKVKYLIIGGIAINLHGVERSTGDMDIMLSMDEKNLLKFVSVMKKLGLTPKVPVKPEDIADPIKLMRWKKEKNMKVFTFIDVDNPYINIDVMTENYISFEKAYKKRIITESWGIDVSLIGIDDLIKLKKIAGREKDMEDIKLLKARKAFK
jgi:predicted nucleotidyltransferase